MNNLLLALSVGLGGACGAACRSWCLDAIDAILAKKKEPQNAPAHFEHILSWLPMAVLLVNVVACFLAGVFGGLGIQGNVQALLLTGFCGGFSTLSTVNLDAARLFSGQVASAPGRSLAVGRAVGRIHAAIYLFVTYAAALAAAALGLFLAL